MDSIQDWVRTLALTLVLAGVADMLVPESGLRRQVRLAVGLVVLAVILAPLIRLQPAAFAQGLERWWSALPAGAGGPGSVRAPAPGSFPGLAGSLSEPVVPDAAGPGTSGAAEPPSETPPPDATLAVYVAMLEQRLVVLAETVPGVSAASVRVSLDSGPWGRWGRVAGLDVTIWTAAGPSPPGGASPPGSVPPVRVGLGTSEPVPAGPLSAAGHAAGLAARVRTLLAQETAVAAEHIRVRLAAGSR